MAPRIFEKSVQKMQSAAVPGFASKKYGDKSETSYASNLTATWNEFFNNAHLDHDVSSMSYGGWCTIKEMTGEPARFEDGVDLKYGQFFYPGISTVVDFGAVNGWTDMLWSSTLLYHQTVKTERPKGSCFTQFVFSVQINSCLFSRCQDAVKNPRHVGEFSDLIHTIKERIRSV